MENHWGVEIRSGKTSRRLTVPMLLETFIRETSETRHAEVGAIVRTGKEVFFTPIDGDVRQVPEWSKPDFVGLVKSHGRYYFGAHVGSGNPADETEVFLYQHAPAEFFRNLLSDVATVMPVEGDIRVNGSDIERTDRPESVISPGSPKRPVAKPAIQVPPAPAGRGWWDISVRWIVLMAATDLTTGKRTDSLAIVGSRPSLILGKLFSTLGNVHLVYSC